jgi:hypothetical protein
LRAADGGGAALVAAVEVTDVALSTGGGRVILAGHAVFCGGQVFPPQLRKPRHSIVATLALASRPRCPRPPWLAGQGVWEGPTRTSASSARQTDASSQVARTRQTERAMAIRQFRTAARAGSPTSCGR